MNNPLLYTANNHVVKSSVEDFFNSYETLIKWQEQETILDVGSGDGGTTMQILVPKLPPNFNKLIGIDISEEMVKFAKSRCQNPKIEFFIYDILSSEVSLTFHETFHHIFSFFCLHWVSDQRQALKNMFKMLKPGGQMLCCFLASSPHFDSWLHLVKSKKWAPYMPDVHKIVPVYHFSNDPKRDLEVFLTEQGFVECSCKLVERTHKFSNFATFSKFLSSLNPYIKHISPNDVNAYVQDYINYNKKYAIFESGTEEVCFTTTVLFGFASKPI